MSTAELARGSVERVVGTEVWNDWYLDSVYPKMVLASVSRASLSLKAKLSLELLARPLEKSLPMATTRYGKIIQSLADKAPTPLPSPRDVSGHLGRASCAGLPPMSFRRSFHITNIELREPLQTPRCLRWLYKVQLTVTRKGILESARQVIASLTAGLTHLSSLSSGGSRDGFHRQLLHAEASAAISLPFSMCSEGSGG